MLGSKSPQPYFLPVRTFLLSIDWCWEEPRRCPVKMLKLYKTMGTSVRKSKRQIQQVCCDWKTWNSRWLGRTERFKHRNYIFLWFQRRVPKMWTTKTFKAIILLKEILTGEAKTAVSSSPISLLQTQVNSLVRDLHLFSRLLLECQ